jgi:hypothetical protein
MQKQIGFIPLIKDSILLIVDSNGTCHFPIQEKNTAANNFQVEQLRSDYFPNLVLKNVDVSVVELVTKKNDRTIPTTIVFKEFDGNEKIGENQKHLGKPIFIDSKNIRKYERKMPDILKRALNKISDRKIISWRVC